MRTRTVIAAAATLGVTLGASAVIAQAAIPDASGTITACMTKSSGTIRLIDTAKEANCRSSEQTVTWNQRGIPGTNGTDGEDGTQLDESSTYLGTGRPPIQLAGGVLYASVCEDGDLAVSWDAFSLNSGLITTQPVSINDVSAWQIIVPNGAPNPIFHAVCLDITP